MMSLSMFNVYCISLHTSVRNSSIGVFQWISFWTKIFPSLFVLHSVFMAALLRLPHCPLQWGTCDLKFPLPPWNVVVILVTKSGNMKYRENGRFRPHFLLRESNSSCFVIGYSSYMCYYSPVMRILFIVWIVLCVRSSILHK